MLRANLFALFGSTIPLTYNLTLAIFRPAEGNFLSLILTKPKALKAALIHDLDWFDEWVFKKGRRIKDYDS